MRTVAANVCLTEVSARVARGALVLEEEGTRHEIEEERISERVIERNRIKQKEKATAS